VTRPNLQNDLKTNEITQDANNSACPSCKIDKNTNRGGVHYEMKKPPHVYAAQVKV
jgi:hypothetical protein